MTTTETETEKLSIGEKMTKGKVEKGFCLDEKQETLAKRTVWKLLRF